MQDEATRYSSYASAALLDHVDDCVVVVDRGWPGHLRPITPPSVAASLQFSAPCIPRPRPPAPPGSRWNRSRRAGGSGPRQRRKAGWPCSPGRDRTLPFSSRFDALFELTPTDLLILQVHPGCQRGGGAGQCRVFAAPPGCWRGAVAGQPVDAVLPPDTAGILAANARICVAQGGFDGECELAFPAGELLVRTVYRLIPSDGSAIDRVLLTQMDLTETRRIEAALRQALRLEVVGATDRRRRA